MSKIFILILIFDCTFGLNVVIFFAKNLINGETCDDYGLKQLGFDKPLRIKHCAPESQPPPSRCKCRQHLKTALNCLINYSRNAKGMTTVIIAENDDPLGKEIRLKARHSENLPAVYKVDLRQKNEEIITEPKHTEYFRNRIRRHGPCDKKNKKPSDFDLFGMMKGTFFMKLFPNYVENDEENRTPPTQHCNTFSLFENVKTALESVEENCQNGFLMIVIGGDLADISSSYSPLVQSIKFIIDNTDEKRTLIIVTGSCSENNEFPAEIGDGLVPLYVKGPRCESLKECTVLYDLPYFIKNIIAQDQG